MTTLSSVSDITRKIFEILVITIGGIVLLFLLIQIGTLIKNIIAPTPAPGPSVSFGKLPKVTFPTNTGPTYSYTINTLSGTLPVLPNRVNVYPLQQPVPDLLALDKAKQIAAAANFTDTPVALSDTLYKWTKSDPFPMNITIDTQSFDFLFTSDYKNNSTITDAAHMPDETTAQTASQSFFDNIMSLPGSIDTSKTKTTLLAITANKLVPASSLSNAQIIRIDYFPKAVDSLPIFSTTPDQSLIYSLVGSGATDYPQVVEAQYIHKTIGNTKATYPILTAQQAFDLLKQGKGYIAANPTNNTNINITDVSLGYYLDPGPQQYLWPIIVFKGDQGFYAYVSAVTSQWIQQ